MGNTHTSHRKRRANDRFYVRTGHDADLHQYAHLPRGPVLADVASRLKTATTVQGFCKALNILADKITKPPLLTPADFEQIREPLTVLLNQLLKKIKLGERDLIGLKASVNGLAKIADNEVLNIVLWEMRENRQSLNDFLKQWIEKAGREIARPSVDFKDLAELVIPLSVLAARPSEAFLSAWFAKAAKEGVLQSADEKKLAFSQHAFANLGICPPQAYIEGWLNVAPDKLTRLDTLTLSLRALAVFKALGAEISREQVEPLFKKFREVSDALAGGVPIASLSSYMLAELTFHPEVFPSIRHDPFRKQVWTASRTQSMFASRLQEIKRPGVEIQQEQYMEATLSPADILLTIQQRGDIPTFHYVQLDGPYHYTYAGEERTLDGGTRLQNYLFDHHRPANAFLTRVPYKEVTTERRAATAQAVLEQAMREHKTAQASLSGATRGSWVGRQAGNRADARFVIT